VYEKWHMTMNPSWGGYSLPNHRLKICRNCKFTPIRRQEFGWDFGLAGKISVHASDMASHMLFHGVPVMIEHQ
jgi:hypothetical protein